LIDNRRLWKTYQILGYVDEIPTGCDKFLFSLFECNRRIDPMRSRRADQSAARNQISADAKLTLDNNDFWPPII
jgi:hypothetical protein